MFSLVFVCSKRKVLSRLDEGRSNQALLQLSAEKKIEKVVLQYSHHHHVRLNHANGILSWNLGFFHVYEQQRYLISSRRVFIIFGGESAREFTRIFSRRVSPQKREAERDFASLAFTVWSGVRAGSGF